MQITVNSYTGSLAAALTKAVTVYHGPQTSSELSYTTVCLPLFSQSEIDSFLAKPSDLVRAGQFWGRRMLASTTRGFVGRFVGPDEMWNTSQHAMTDRMELCAAMMRAAPETELMAMMVPKSEARAFLSSNCDDFEVASDLRFSNFEVGPQFLVTAGIVKLNESYLQTWNAVSKFLFATEEYRALENRYIGSTGVSCPTSGADDVSALTLYQQAGAAHPVCLRVQSSAVDSQLDVLPQLP